METALIAQVSTKDGNPRTSSSWLVPTDLVQDFVDSVKTPDNVILFSEVQVYSSSKESKE